MSGTRLILIGGGGHCKSCIEVIESTGRFAVAGILDLPSRKGAEVLGYPILGGDDELEACLRNADGAIVTLGHMKSCDRRKVAFERLMALSVQVPSIVAQSAIVSRHARIGAGTMVFHQAVVNAGVAIGSNCIINSLSLVEHDAVIGNHVHVSTGARVNGGARVGDRCFVGSGAILKENVKICDDVIIGAGALVLHDITKPGVYVGAPARERN